VKPKPILQKLVQGTRKFFWAILVAFMVALHNFYKGEYHSPDDLRPKIDPTEQEKAGK
jgi:hypothetical protein